MPSKKREATNERERNEEHGSVISVHKTASAQEVWTVAATNVKDRGDPPYFMATRLAGPKH